MLTENGKILSVLLSLSLSFALLLSPLDARAEMAVINPDLAAISPRGVGYQTEAAVTSSLSRTATLLNGKVLPAHSSAMRALRDAVVAETQKVINGAYMEKGDVLVGFSVEHNEIKIGELMLAYNIAEAAYVSELAALEETLSDEIAALGKMSPIYTARDVRRTQELRVERAREKRDYAIYSNERALDIRRTEIEKLREESEDFVLTAPVSGYISDMPYLYSNTEVSAGDLIATISDPLPFFLSFTEGNMSPFKQGVAVTINAIQLTGLEEYSFSGHVISNSTLLGVREVGSRTVVSFDDIDEFIETLGSRDRVGNFRYTADVSLPVSDSALLVPSEAVKQEGSLQYVNILEDGLRKKRYVLTGMSDTTHTQILEGIEEGMSVILY